MVDKHEIGEETELVGGTRVNSLSKGTILGSWLWATTLRCLFFCVSVILQYIHEQPVIIETAGQYVFTLKTKSSFVQCDFALAKWTKERQTK